MNLEGVELCGSLDDRFILQIIFATIGDDNYRKVSVSIICAKFKKKLYAVYVENL